MKELKTSLHLIGTMAFSQNGLWWRRDHDFEGYRIRFSLGGELYRGGIYFLSLVRNYNGWEHSGGPVNEGPREALRYLLIDGSFPEYNPKAPL